MDKLWDDVLRHWEMVVLNPLGERIGPYSCAFCMEFNTGLLSDSEEHIGCPECPIRKHSGSNYCEGTPYTRAVMAHRHCEHVGSVHEKDRPMMWLEYRFLVRLYREKGNE